MKLKNVKHLDELRRLRLPMNDILLVGSTTMSLLGLKENDDIDIWSTNKAFKLMANDKNLIPVKKNGRLFYESKSGNIEISNKMPCTKGPVENYLKRSILIYGIHFQSVDDLIDWKKCMGRPKDKEHLKLLYQYKKNKVTESYLDLLKRI
jgi:hypothetical protein